MRSRQLKSREPEAVKRHHTSRDARFQLPQEKLLVFDQRDLGYFCGFPASNEYDFFSQSTDRRKAEVFLGFGNNTVWDLAMRRRAELVVQVDRDEEVLRVQEYLYRPLVLVSRGQPARLLSLLSAVPIPESLLDAKLDDVFSFIDEYRNMVRATGKERPRAIDDFVESVIKDVSARRDLTAAHIIFVKRHLNWLVRPRDARKSSVYGGALGHIYASRGLADLYSFFRDRYCPARLVAKGADPDLVHMQDFSVLSSADSFSWLTSLLEQGRYAYAVSDITDPQVYRAAAEFARRMGMTVDGISLSNIPDSVSSRAPRSTAITCRVLETAMAELPTGSCVTAYHTRGASPPHTFETYELRESGDVVRELERTGQCTDSVERRSDVEFVLDAILSERPTVVHCNRFGLRLCFGDRCHVHIQAKRDDESADEYVDSDKFYFSDVRDKREVFLIPSRRERERLGRVSLLSAGVYHRTATDVAAFLAQALPSFSCTEFEQ